MAKRRSITPIYPYDPLEKFEDEKRTPPRPTAKGQNPPKPLSKVQNTSNSLPYVAVCLAAFVTLCTVVCALVVYIQVFDLLAIRKEKASLLALAEALVETPPEAKNTPTVTYIGAFDAKMRQINPDYLCWIKIDDTHIDNPVVRGKDNDTYLSVSFYGEENAYGTLFMDYRCIGDYVPHIIIYGHNARTGDMFGGLRKYLDADYLAGHPVITLKVNNRDVAYEIFAARKTDISDAAYNLDFNTPDTFRAFAEQCGAPPDTDQILTLSTCVSAGNDAERVIVQGFFREK